MTRAEKISYLKNRIYKGDHNALDGLRKVLNGNAVNKEEFIKGFYDYTKQRIFNRPAFIRRRDLTALLVAFDHSSRRNWSEIETEVVKKLVVILEHSQSLNKE
jgi:hypothetical protein